MRLIKDKRTIALPLLIAIILSSLGIAYAHWSEVIRINGTVEMGSLTLGFIEVVCVDKEYVEELPKDIGKFECSLDEYVMDEHTGKEGYRKIHVKIINGYPSYYVFATFIVDNLGNVPAVFKTVTLMPDPPLVAVFVPPNEWELIDPTLPGEPVVLNVRLVNLVNIQLDPCHQTKAELDTFIKQPAPECHTYSFHVEIVAENWDP